MMSIRSFSITLTQLPSRRASRIAKESSSSSHQRSQKESTPRSSGLNQSHARKCSQADHLIPITSLKGQALSTETLDALGLSSHKRIVC